MDYRHDYTEDELEKMASGLTPEFPPGSRWNYSNTGYVLLGIIIHKASGQFYGDVLRERVFTPLGMRSARVISEADIVPNRAAGYDLVKGELKNQEWVAPKLNTTADGSLYLSLQDYIAWDRGLRAKKILVAGELGDGVHARHADERKSLSVRVRMVRSTRSRDSCAFITAARGRAFRPTSRATSATT